MSEANIHAARGVALREFPLQAGHGFADYLLYIDAKAAGVIEAKKEGVTLTGVEPQSNRYAQGLPEAPVIFLSLVCHLPPLIETGMWSAQVRAIRNLEASLAADKPCALIEIATDTGNDFAHTEARCIETVSKGRQ